MPSGSTYIVDINKIRKPGNVGTGGIFIGLGSSKRESLFAVRGTGSGNVVIYDKVLYELDANNISNLEPNAQTVTLTYTKSKKTHGDDSEETLGITPTTANITANTNTGSTKATTVTIRNATGTTATGASVTVTLTQKADYFVNYSNYSITGTPSSTANIPYNGGTNVRSLTVASKRIANYKSGNQVTVGTTFKVTNITNCTLKTSGGATISEGTTGLSDGTVINVTVSSRQHELQTRDVSFDITCDNDTTKTYHISWTQDNDGYSYSRTVTSTSVSSNSIGVNGGTVTLTFGINNYIYYKWASDGTEFLYSHNNDGTATISSSDSSNCSVSPTTVSNESSITCTVTNNRHSTSTRSFTISASVGGGSGTVSQSADSLYNGTTTESTSFTTTDTNNIPANGGTRTITFYVTQSTPRYWASDNVQYDTQYTYTGSTTLSTSNCSVDSSTLSNGDSTTVRVGSTSSQRTVSVTESRSSRSISWTQDGQSLLTPSFTWVNIAFASDPEPTPTGYLFDIVVDNQLSSWDIAFGIATANTASAIIASGYTTRESTENAINEYLNLSSNTQPLYLFAKLLSGSHQTYMGFGTADSQVAGIWLSSAAEMFNLSTTWTQIGGAAPRSGYPWASTNDMTIFTL